MPSDTDTCCSLPTTGSRGCRECTACSCEVTIGGVAGIDSCYLDMKPTPRLTTTPSDPRARHRVRATCRSRRQSPSSSPPPTSLDIDILAIKRHSTFQTRFASKERFGFFASLWILSCFSTPLCIFKATRSAHFCTERGIPESIRISDLSICKVCHAYRYKNAQRSRGT